MSPLEIFIDARVELCNSPEWEIWQGEHYPKRAHLAHTFLERAERHLGVRALDGYGPRLSVTAELMPEGWAKA